MSLKIALCRDGRRLSESRDLPFEAYDEAGTPSGRCQADSDAIVAQASRSEADPEIWSRLRTILDDLRAFPEDHASVACAKARDILLRLLAADVPAQLVARLDSLDFEVQKDAMRVFSAILSLGARIGAQESVIGYMRGHPQITHLLLEGCGRPTVFHYCGEMLRSSAQYPELLADFVERGALGKLLGLLSHPSFDISLEAFSSLRELFFAQREISATYLEAHFEEFFELYHALLQGEEYVIQRQALKLLGEVLLDRSFQGVMVSYVGNDRFLQIHMNLLRDSSLAIQLDAFHVFKIFVANPSKTPRIQQVLHRNRDRLVSLLKTFATRRESDDAFAEDLQAMLGMLEMLPPPSSA